MAVLFFYHNYFSFGSLFFSITLSSSSFNMATFLVIFAPNAVSVVDSIEAGIKGGSLPNNKLKGDSFVDFDFAVLKAQNILGMYLSYEIY